MTAAEVAALRAELERERALRAEDRRTIEVLRQDKKRLQVRHCREFIGSETRGGCVSGMAIEDDAPSHRCGHGRLLFAWACSGLFWTQADVLESCNSRNPTRRRVVLFSLSFVFVEALLSRALASPSPLPIPSLFPFILFPSFRKRARDELASALLDVEQRAADAEADLRATEEVLRAERQRRDEEDRERARQRVSGSAEESSKTDRSSVAGSPAASSFHPSGGPLPLAIAEEREKLLIRVGELEDARQSLVERVAALEAGRRAASEAAAALEPRCARLKAARDRLVLALDEQASQAAAASELAAAASAALGSARAAERVWRAAAREQEVKNERLMEMLEERFDEGGEEKDDGGPEGEGRRLQPKAVGGGTYVSAAVASDDPTEGGVAAAQGPSARDASARGDVPIAGEPRDRGAAASSSPSPLSLEETEKGRLVAALLAAACDAAALERGIVPALAVVEARLRAVAAKRAARRRGAATGSAVTTT